MSNVRPSSTNPFSAADSRETRGAGVVAIALGREHGLALKSDGTVVVWGNAYGVPPGLVGVTAIAAGSTWSVALKGDGTVVAWGNSSAGATEVPHGLTGVVAVAAGMGHCIALKSDGTVVAWGSNSDGQADVPYGLSGVTAIAAGSWHSLALQRDGGVVAWGHPDSDQRHVPYGLTGAVAIAAGSENSSAIFADGTVVDWGADIWFGATPDDFCDVAAIAYGWKHRLALRKDGTVVSDGWEMGGLTVPANLTEIIAIAGASSPMTDHRSFIALRRDGSVVAIKHDIAADTARGRRFPALELPPDLTHPTAAESDSRPFESAEAEGIGVPSRALISEDDLQFGKTALMAWAAVGDETQVRALIDEGDDVAAVDDDGDGVLRYAITSRNPRIFEMLLERGADPDAIGTSASGRAGFTILHAVAEIGWDEAIAALLRHGAQIDARGEGGITALMLASGAGRDSSVTLLADAGADIDAVDDDADSVLFYAASNGQKSAVNLLLDLGADPDLPPGSSGWTPLTVAAQLASPLGSERPMNVPPSDFVKILLQLVLAGADPTAMYEAGYLLQDSSNAIAPLSKVRQLAAIKDGWTVIYATPEFRRNYIPEATPSAEPSQQPSRALTLDSSAETSFGDDLGSESGSSDEYDYAAAVIRTLREVGRPMSDDELWGKVMRSPDVPAHDREMYWTGPFTSGPHPRNILMFRIAASMMLSTDGSGTRPDAPLLTTSEGYWLPEWPLTEKEKRRRAELIARRESSRLVSEVAPVRSPGPPTPSSKGGGCYVATHVYGSYDCPEVWVLRRWRDTYLASTTLGPWIIRLYYRVSPIVVRALGRHTWFTSIVRRPLDGFVATLRAAGFSPVPYSDLE